MAKYGVTYSHVAFVLHEEDGSWTVRHLLNACGTAQSALFSQGLAQFMLDADISSKVALVVPRPEVQERLLAVLSPDQERLMHSAHYSAVAYPFSTKYQNSDGWVLETFSRAIVKPAPTSRKAAQDALVSLAYEPSTLHLGTFTRLGARITQANVEFDDHPGDLRWSGIIKANTGDSTLRFVAEWGAAVPACAPALGPPRICELDTDKDVLPLNPPPADSSAGDVS